MPIDTSKYQSNDFNATYSPEDNKLRLYADVRIDQDDWQMMKDNGWRWAPKQELFFCFWSVKNEDFCLAIAGDILPEEMTLVERAEAKANRLLILAQKRADQSVGYQKTALDLQSRVANNQPILIGHHSQRKAEKVNTQIERSIEKANDTAQAVGYWVWRSKGVIGHANYKNQPRVIYGRIKTLLKDLRDAQKTINESDRYLRICERLEHEQDLAVKTKVVLSIAYDLCSYEYRRAIEDGNVTIDDAFEKIKQTADARVHSVNRARYISHTLNRLAYEQNQLAITPLYEGDLSAAIIQTFLRTHGAEKPKAIKSDNGFIAESSVSLPLHIGNGRSLELDNDEWRELMQALGYEVPSAKKQNPILNFKSETPFLIKALYDRGNVCLEQIEVTKETIENTHPDRKRVRKSVCGTFRFRTILVQKDDAKGYWDTEEKAVYITDSKSHSVPDSMRDNLLVES
jgi:hypothetical protein